MIRRLSMMVAVLAAIALPAHAAPLKVVATFSILGDMVRQVGGDAVAVTTLVGPDADAHVFEPTPAAVKQLAQANLVVANGLGLEPWLKRLSVAAGYTGPMAVATQGLAPLTAGEGHRPDPHAWQDLANGHHYVAAIARALSDADPAHAAAYQANAQAYAGRLAGLDAWVRAQVAAIPPERRRIITTHDAFGYFGRAYGIELLAPQGLNTEAEPTAGDLARLARQMKAEKVKAVFLENMTDPRLMAALARDVGAVVGGTLYADALSPPDGPAPTYEAMFRHNMRTLGEAMAKE